MLESFKAWINRSPKWLLTATITVLAFISGDQHRQIVHLQDAVAAYESERQKNYVQAMQDKTRRDVDVAFEILKGQAAAIGELKTIVADYRGAVERNTTAVERLASQVGRLADQTAKPMTGGYR